MTEPVPMLVSDQTGYEWVPCGSCPHPIEAHNYVQKSCWGNGGACKCTTVWTLDDIMRLRKERGFPRECNGYFYLKHEPCTWSPAPRAE